MLFHIETISSLAKILCRPEKNWNTIRHLTALRGERISFQIAVKAHTSYFALCKPVKGSPFADKMKIRFVGNVPALIPASPSDPQAFATTPGVFPDPLYEQGLFTKLTIGNWHGFFVQVEIPRDAKPGKYRLQLAVEGSWDYPVVNGERQEVTLDLTVNRAEMPVTQSARFTNWFYADSIMKQHKVECWSEAHWQLLEAYMRNFTAHGSNMLLTPLWTVPLDVEVGAHRPHCQLLKIREKGGVYHFDFGLLDRWIETAQRSGVETFEMVHAFSQWGAKSAPCILIENEQGVTEERFGWDVPACDPSYAEFLRQLMQNLLPYLRNKGLQDKVYFHISDEPSLKSNYSKAAEIFQPLVEEFPVIDALSNVEFFQTGAVKIPVPSVQSFRKFLQEDIKERWVYFCGNPSGYLPARAFGTPSLRNRILGLLMYFYDLNGGFLHWGYNAYFTQLSRTFDINVYLDPCWGTVADAGNAFLVYPGDDGPVDSLRHEVFFEAVQDYRAMRLLESRIGREKVIRLIHSTMPKKTPFDISWYLMDNAWYLRLRDKINKALDRTEEDA